MRRLHLEKTTKKSCRYSCINTLLDILIDIRFIYEDALDTSSYIARLHVSLCVSSVRDDS